MKSKWLKRGVWTLVWVVSLGSLFYAEENWRGARAWKAYEGELRAKGEPLTIQEMLPERPPDELNMAMAPVFAPMFDFKKQWNPRTKRNEWVAEDEQASLRYRAIELPGGLDTGINPTTGSAAELKEIREACADDPEFKLIPSTLADGPYLLEALSRRSKIFREVEEAAGRPQSYWPIPYEEGFLATVPNFRGMLVYVKAFTLRATVSLAVGKSGDAYRDWLVTQKLAESLSGEPLLISHMIGLGLETVSIGVVWEGLRSRAWSDQQLENIESRLAKKDISREYARSIRGERVYALAIILKVFTGDWRQGEAILGGAGDWKSRLGTLIYFGWRPRGWIDLERCEYARFIQDSLLSGGNSPHGEVDFSKVRVAVDQFDKSGATWLGRLVTPLADMALPKLASMSAWSAKTQTLLRQAALGCALEKYRRIHGAFPEHLAQLEVEPATRRDPVTESDMVYRLENGGYVIYSVGWNLKDDGGRDGSDNHIEEDWTWRMPFGTEAGPKTTEDGTKRK